MITTFHNIHQLLLQITFAPLSRLCSAIHPLKTPQVGYSILHPHFSCLQCVLWVLNSPGSFFNFPEFQVTVSNNFLEASSLFTRSLHLRRLLTFIVIFKIRYYIAVQYPPFFFLRILSYLSIFCLVLGQELTSPHCPVLIEFKSASASLLEKRYFPPFNLSYKQDVASHSLLYYYSHGKCLDKLQSLVPPGLTFMTRTCHATLHSSKSPIFPLYSISKT